MNLDSLSFALSQISYSVANLTKKNYKSSVAEISHLVAHHGAEAERHLFRCLFSHVDFSGDGKSSGKDFHQTQYLIQECVPLLTKPNFISTLCYAIDNPLHHQKSLKASGHLNLQLSKVLKLNRMQEVVFGLAQLNSTNPETRSFAAQFVKNKLPHLLNSYIDEGVGGEGGLQDVAVEVIHLLLTHLVHNRQQLGITTQQKEAFLKVLRKDFPQDRAPVILAPLLYPESQDFQLEKLVPKSTNMPKSAMEGSLADVVLEIGYTFTSSVDECRNTMVQFGVREITPEAVARVLAAMTRTPSGLSDQISIQNMNNPSVSNIWTDGKDKPESAGPTTWNVDIFVQVVKELASHLAWREVVVKLDHPEFIIQNKQGLRILTQSLFRGLDNFPIDTLCQPWKNTEGQLSWITQSLKNPDVFCLADYPCHAVVIDILKTPPDEDNRDIATWKSLDLVETLLHLSGVGHYQQVSELFKFPVQHCPDMLVLALLQMNTWTSLKHELLSNLMPIFLGNHPNSAIVLHYSWHCQGQSNTIRTLIMHAMAEWYMRGEHHDQTRLSRILDVAQDLKALSMLLNASPFAFVIDLACLASRREYLKLDKWLSDKIREHGEPFVQASANFLKRRCPQLMGGVMKDDQQPQTKSQQIPPETLATMLTCIQACAANVAQELSDTILTMVANANVILKPRSAAPGVVGAKAGAIAPPTPLQGLPNPVGNNSMDPMGGMPPVGGSLGPVGGLPVGPLGAPPTSAVGGTPFNMAPTSQSHQGYNPIQSITSQLHTLSMSTTMSTANSMPGGSGLGNIGGGGLGSIGGGLGSIGGGGLGSIGGTSLGSIGGGSLGSIGGGITSSSMGGGSSGSGSSSGLPGGGGGPNLGGPGLGGSGGPLGGGPLGGGPLGGGPLGGGPIGGGPLGGGPLGGGPLGGGPLGGGPLGGGPLGGGPLGGGPLGGGPLGGGPLGGGPLGGGPLGGGPLGGGPLGGGPLGGGGSGGGLVGGLGGGLGGALGGGGLGGGGLGGSSLSGADLTQGGLGSSSGRSPALGALSGGAGNPSGGKVTQPGGSDRFGRSMSQQFSKEIEDEANSYFQRIYNHPPHPTISIDDVLEMLKRFKDSPVKKEREVFACMLRNLFEEYRFFPQYPDKELHTTAVLFGGIIEQGLVTYMDLGIALRYVLEALKKPHGSKMYYFGIAALDRFKTRLKDYPQYCQHLASIQHFSQFPSHLIEYVEFGARSQEPPNRPQGPVTSPSLTPITSTSTSNATPTSAVATSPAMSTTPTQGTPKSGSGVAPKGRQGDHPSIANATNIDTLLAGTEGQKEEILVPPENLQDKVFFIFNNLSLSNMETKAAELLEHTTDEYLPWVAQYMVMKRASIEPNFHRLYANFIDSLKRTEFFNMVIRETFRNIKVLLRSDKGVNNFSDRSLLKNLGHWLGLLTLAKNKPILHVDIDLKSLVYEAYYKGAQELLFVVPFVAKVLESCAKSKVFKPPNPWTMGIMNVLAELHQEEGLKLNLKFEIEVLCKTLSLDINDLKAATYLNDQERSKTIENQLSAPKPKETPTTPQPEETMAVNIVNIPGVVSTTTVLSSTPTTNTTSTAASVSTPPQPQFVYHDINIMSLGGMAPHITINEQLGLFQAHPRLKQFVRPAIEHSVQELLHPVVERSIKIALTTCEQIVRKDFALDPEEVRMRAAAHHMVRNMTAGMALITCREPLLISINNNLKNAFLTSLGGATQPQKELIELAAQVIAQENTELACAFIQKTAVEKAIPEMDKRLATEFELRKHARNEGRRYCDPVVLTYQAERMPEQIRLKVGGVTPQQIAVYEEFARNIPGFLATAPQAAQDNPLFKAAQPPQPSYVTDEITQIYDKIVRDIEQHLHAIIAPHGSPQITQVHLLLEAVLVARNSREIVTAIALLQKAVDGLLDGLQSMPQDHEVNFRFRDCHLIVLKGLQDHRAYGAQWTNKQVTSRLIECREDYRYNLEAVMALIHAHLVNMQQYDSYLASAMENGLNYVAVAFAITLVQRFCLDDKQGSQLNEADFFATIETLARIAAHSRQAPEGLTTLIETIRQRNEGSLLDKAPTMMCSGISQAREFDDPPGLHEKTEYLLREWVTMYHSPAAGRDSTKAFSAFVTQMHQHGILKTDDLITRFFRLCTEMCVDLCYRALAEQSASPTMVRAKCFHTLDAFVRLIALLVKHSGEANNTATKINLLSKVLGIVAGVLLQDHEVRHTDFQQLPYHRIFIMLFIELNVPEHVLESINYQVLTAFCNAFHILRPAKAPGFAYAWLELISHRVYIGRLLAVPPQQRGWNMYAQLLIDLFKFLVPFLRNADLAKPTQLLYKGTLRVLLILLHDFPEFLCDYHYAFCDVIPPNCIQMRNLILSAFPRNMRLPDPFTPNLKVDMLSDIAHPPRIMTNYTSAIQPASFKKDLDSYLKTRSPVTFLSELRSNLQVSNEPGVRYNVQMMNALVLYVGTQAISHIHNKGLTPSMSTIAHSSHMDIFQNLAVDLDTRGRYLFLSSIANQLRFPNSHTHYFSCTLLYLFSEANTEAIQEQITRVLLERLIVNRPHPWGLLITFIELIKNPQFKFWNHEFVHCAPEIEKLFESVARSCMQPRQQQAMRDQEVTEVH